MSGRWIDTGKIENAWRELDVPEKTADALALEAATAVRWSLAGLLELIPSPIERKLLLALIACRKTDSESVPSGRDIRLWVNGKEGQAGRFGALDDYDGVITIECQKPIGKYAADFVVSWSDMTRDGRGFASVAVEADGHDFHERTKEQAAHDKKRDRFFAAQGITLLRFTGSEIHRAADKCATEVFTVLWPRVEADAAQTLTKWMAK